jgi:hypothetical protein
MSAASAIKTLLEADATLLATATGGVWDWQETGRLGISRETTPAAYDSNNLLKPCLLVKGRGERPDGQIADQAGRVLSTREIVELWFYEDEGYTNIQTMQNRAFALLHEVQVSGTFIVRWAGRPLAQQRDDAMGNVSVERDDYQAIALKSA